jgi:hypothetical protein
VLLYVDFTIFAGWIDRKYKNIRGGTILKSWKKIIGLCHCFIPMRILMECQISMKLPTNLIPRRVP